ncbi:hypothetical protein [Microcoleus sp. OTE_8_concoct_300]|uniref:hypothetical protein n=1 Tax=Microcoleus sp. OTE_8_concoct_300 TaxID=2964710 RepID=UPI00403FA515
MDANRPLCGHLITHLDPEVEALMQEKFRIDFSQIAKMGLAEWAEFGQLGIDAKWVIDNIDKIEEIFGNVITSIELWNKAVEKVSKKGIKVVEKLDKGAVDLAIAVTGRNSKLLEGDDRKANAVSLQSELRTVNNELDQIANGSVLARALAKLEEAREKAANEPAVQAGIRAWANQAKQTALAAKMGLQHGLAAFSHPQFPGNDGTFTGSDWTQPSNSNQSWGQNYEANKPQQSLGGSNRDSIAFNWSGNVAGKAKQFSSNVVRGAKKIGKWFGIG